jgi:hypothetical protein
VEQAQFEALIGRMEMLASARPSPTRKTLNWWREEEKELQAAEAKRSSSSGRVSRRYCIYDNDEDYQRASEILLKLGAAREPMNQRKRGGMD